MLGAAACVVHFAGRAMRGCPMSRDPLATPRPPVWLSAASIVLGVILGAALGLASGQPALALMGIAIGVIAAVLAPLSVRAWQSELPFDLLLTERRGPARLVERYLLDVIQAGDLDEAERLFSHAHRYRDPEGSPFGTGPPGMREFAVLVRSSVIDPRVEITKIEETGDHVRADFSVGGVVRSGERSVRIALRLDCEVASRRIVETVGAVALVSRLSWIAQSARALLEERSR